MGSEITEAEIETTYAATLSLDADGALVIDELTSTEISLLPYADNWMTAVSLLKMVGQCRMNINAEILADIINGLAA